MSKTPPTKNSSKSTRKPSTVLEGSDTESFEPLTIRIEGGPVGELNSTVTTRVIHLNPILDVRDIKIAGEPSAEDSERVFDIFKWIMSERPRLKDPKFHIEIASRIALDFEGLDIKGRIRILHDFLHRIAISIDTDQKDLTDEEIVYLARTIDNAILQFQHVVPIETITSPIERIHEQGYSSALSEKWREKIPSETSAQYFERVIAPIPFSMRPSTTVLLETQPDLHKALTSACYEQKRYNRIGFGEAGRAHKISDLLPIGVPKPRSPRNAKVGQPRADRTLNKK